MLQIHHADDDRSASKIYADTLWQDDPRLSPDWWREALGYTVGKLALDWRNGVTDPEYLTQGCNLVLTSATAHAAVRRTLAAHVPPDSVAEILVSERPRTLTAPCAFILWATDNPTHEERLETLTHLENQVKSGAIQAYGLSVPHLPNPPLHIWLGDAAKAAEIAYGRRKRPSLRLLHAPLDLTDLSLLTAPVTLHKTEAVTTLELASRLGFAVIVSPTTDLSITQPPLESLAALTDVAKAEYALNQSLNGWPQVDGQQLFSVLAHLSQGQTPWNTLSQWHNWQKQFMPELLNHWQAIDNPLVKPYLNLLQNLAHHGESLARAAQAARHRQLLTEFASRLPATHQNLTLQEQTLLILSAIPGITAVAPAVPLPPQQLRKLPDIPDIGAVLLA